MLSLDLVNVVSRAPPLWLANSLQYYVALFLHLHSAGLQVDERNGGN